MFGETDGYWLASAATDPPLLNGRSSEVQTPVGSPGGVLIWGGPGRVPCAEGRSGIRLRMRLARLSLEGFISLSNLQMHVAKPPVSIPSVAAHVVFKT